MTVACCELSRTEPKASKQASGRKLNFLANVDPIDVARALKGLDPEETLVVVVSKTFTTAETMLNARTVRQWLKSRMGKITWGKLSVSRNIVCNTDCNVYEVYHRFAYGLKLFCILRT